MTSQLPQGTNNTFNYATLTQRLQIKIAALQAMFNAVSTISQLVANPATSSAQISTFEKGYVYSSGSAYISQITQLATGVQLPPNDSGNSWEQTVTPSSISGNYQTLQSYGWIQAGSYYYTMVKASGAQLDPETIYGQAILPAGHGIPMNTTLSTNGMPSGSGWPTNDTSYTTGVTSLLSGGSPYYETTSLNTALANANTYYNSDQNTPAPPTQGITTTNASTGNGFMDAIVGGIASAIRNPILSYIQNLAGGNGTDPLISLGQFGTSLMLAGEMSVFAALVTSIAISLAASSMSCMSPFAWGVNLILVQLMPLIYGAAAAIWTAGATFGVYIPMVPYLIFTTSAFGWMIAVVEAVVGAPIIALGLTHPSDGELGKVTDGLTMLANIFLRPTLMIFGFVLGASLLRAALALINFGFIPALNEGTNATIFSIVAVLAMYMFLVMSLINKSFALIYELPNKILRWMGGRSEEFSPADMIKEAKEGHDLGAKAGQMGVSKGVEKFTSDAKAATDKRNQGLKGQGGGNMPSPPAGK